MKKLKTLTIVWVVILSMPFTSVAAGTHEQGSQGHEQGSQGHEQAAAMDLPDGMSAEGAMFIVGDQINDGVRGMAHLKNVSRVMAKLGMKTTHHFMIAFVDEATGEQIMSGAAAIKITSPDGKTGKAIELIEMDGHFGADVVLDKAGEYHFKIGTKLLDGKKRKFHFNKVFE